MSTLGTLTLSLTLSAAAQPAEPDATASEPDTEDGAVGTGAPAPDPAGDPTKPNEPDAGAAETPDAGSAPSEPDVGESESDAGPGSSAGTPSPDGPLHQPPPGGPEPRKRSVTTRAGQDVADPTEWKFDFHGYFHAPMRVGTGTREPAEGEDSLPPGQNDVTFHAPIVPDDQYLSYQHTNHSPRSWAELYFSYGNQIAKGTVAIEAFNFTDAAWNQAGAQLGISQGFVTITPRFKRTPLRFRAKVGAFDGRYGMAGKYDQGQYETYLFGRTHGMGETMELGIPIRRFEITLEHGIGATRPDPNIWNTSRFTLFQHAHVGASWKKMVTLGGHFLAAIAREEVRDVPAAEPGVQEVDAPDGRMISVGPDLRFDGGRYGYLYTGFSYIKGEGARVVGPSIEVIHAQGGGNYSLGIVDNYLEDGLTDADGDSVLDNDSGGNGEIFSYMVQVDHSVKKIMKGDEFWGEGMDFALSLYLMFNHIKSDDADRDGVNRIKYGADGIFSALPWLGVALRYDRVQPHSEIPEQSFSVLSPRLIFRSAWVTREMITVQYSRYLYNQRTCDPTATGADLRLCVQPPSAPGLPDGFGSTAEDLDDQGRGAPVAPPDENVIMISASMWW